MERAAQGGRVSKILRLGHRVAGFKPGLLVSRGLGLNQRTIPILIQCSAFPKTILMSQAPATGKGEKGEGVEPAG